MSSVGWILGLPVTGKLAGYGWLWTTLVRHTCWMELLWSVFWDEAGSLGSHGEAAFSSAALVSVTSTGLLLICFSATLFFMHLGLPYLLVSCPVDALLGKWVTCFPPPHKVLDLYHLQSNIFTCLKVIRQEHFPNWLLCALMMYNLNVSQLSFFLTTQNTYALIRASHLHY